MSELDSIVGIVYTMFTCQGCGDLCFSHSTTIKYNCGQRAAYVNRRDLGRERKCNIGGFLIPGMGQMEETTGFIYFIQSVNGGPIKVGFTTDPNLRLQTLQNMSPFKLNILLICRGTLQAEKMTHKHLEKYHSHGEWFEPSSYVLGYLELLKKDLGTENYLEMRNE